MSGFNWDWSFAFSILPELLNGLATTLLVTAISAAIALPLGLALILIRLAGIPIISPAVWFMVEFLRGTPFLVQLYFIFYVLPNYGLTFSPLATGVFALGVYGGARAAELYRAGLEAIPAGQWEACQVLGLPLGHVWAAIILPQVAQVVIPMLGNLVIVMFKDSAVLSTITVLELVARAKDIGVTTFRYLEPLTLAGFLFWVVSYLAARGIRRLELRDARA
jgi:polar amino acid transport system permease protein